MAARLLLAGLLAAALASPAVGNPAGRDEEPAPLRIARALSIAAEDGEAEEDAWGMEEERQSSIEQGLFELRVRCLLWIADLDAVSRTSTGDMRLAEALNNLDVFGTGIHHLDLVEEMDLPSTYVLVNPEIGLRLRDTAFRLSWWWFRETRRVIPDRVHAFGDVVYAEDWDTATRQRIPPDTPPSSGVGIPRITFTAELMDTKLLFEYRANASDSLEVYAGMAVHWLRYAARADTDVRVFSAWEDGSIRDREKVDDDRIGDYPLVSVSTRVEWRPLESFYVSLDLQEMYLYFGNYTDLKIGVWNQACPWVRVGLGYRLWNIQAELYELGSSKMDIDVNVALSGLWFAVFAIL